MIVFLVFTMLAVAGVVGAGYAYVVDHRRRQVLDRAFGEAAPAPVRSPLLAAPAEGPIDRLRDEIAQRLPTEWLNDVKTRERLLRAGFDDERAVVAFVAARMVLVVLMPLLALSAFTVHSVGTLMLLVIGAAVAGWIAPAGYVDGAMRRRQQKIRHAIPDTLDLLLVCVEAGVGLESAMLRVARDMAGVHPELAAELAVALRRMKAGVTREDALRGLYDRTGVEELRTLVASVLQSERWGTSIGRVLRVSADTLRRKRRQNAEKKAQTASVKMTIPLVSMILPALFIALLGPSVLLLFGALRGQ